MTDTNPIARTTTPSTPEPLSWSDPARGIACQQWLLSVAAGLQARDGTVLHPSTLRPANADASFRRYLRLDASAADGQKRSFIVMDAPPAHENCAPFVQVHALLQAAGLRVAAIHAWDAQQGFMLLDDLGPRALIDYLDPARPDAAAPWYQAAASVLIPWQISSQKDVLPPYDAALLQRELDLFPQWYIGQHRQFTLTNEQKNTLQNTFNLIIQNNLSAPQVFVHRDFMTRNLMPAENLDINTPLAVLDFQDAVFGPVTYDIASLTRDAFISWEEDFVIDIVVRYWEKARAAGIIGANSASGWGADFGEFWRAVEWMALQRHLKVAGIFARLTLRDNKPKYLADAPRFIHYIRSTCARYRELGPLLKLIDQIENIQPQYGYSYGRAG